MFKKISVKLTKTYRVGMKRNNVQLWDIAFASIQADIDSVSLSPVEIDVFDYCVITNKTREWNQLTSARANLFALIAGHISFTIRELSEVGNFKKNIISTKHTLCNHILIEIITLRKYLSFSYRITYFVGFRCKIVFLVKPVNASKRRFIRSAEVSLFSRVWAFFYMELINVPFCIINEIPPIFPIILDIRICKRGSVSGRHARKVFK